MKGAVKELIKSREGKASALVVLMYGLLLGYFVWYTFFDYVPRTYPVSWQASWIAHPDEEVSQSVYRKKVYLASSIRHAWIKVMAPDNFTVYANGRLLGRANRLSDNVTQYFDLTAMFKPGTNVIAISTYRKTYPGTSKIVVEGTYEDWQGIEHKLLSDESWKVSRFEEWQLSGEPQWYEPAFNDTHWKYAKVTGVPVSEDNSKVAFDPFIYTEKVRGHWVRSPSLTSPNLYLRYQLNVAAKPKDAWIRIASRQDQAYHLTVNEILVDGKQRSVGPVAEIALPDQSLNMYNVTSLLKRGLNVIAIRVTGWPTKLEVLVDGLVRDHRGKALLISTPTGWKAATVESPRWTSLGFDDSPWGPAQSSSAVVAGDRLEKNIEEPILPDGYRLTNLIQMAFCLFMSALLTLLLWFLFGIVFSNGKGMELTEGLSLLSLAYSLPLLFLGFVLLLGYDVRFDQAFPFQEKFVFVGLVLPLLFVVLLLVRGRGQESHPIRRLFKLRYAGVLLVLITAVSLILRLKDIDLQVLNGDEVTMAFYTQSVLEKGYPAMQLSSNLPEKIITTSELVPYAMAISSALFNGMSIEFRQRFNGALFGVLTTVLLYLFGASWLDKRAGLLAAGLYAALPISIRMAQYGRYPTQLECFGLLTLYFFYRYISPARRTERVHKYAYLTLLFFGMTYFSWEGSAFLLPAGLLGLLVFKGRDLSWFKDKHLWLIAGLASIVIFIQLGFRYLQASGNLVLGSGISDISIAPQWLQPLYDPIAFLTNFLFVEKTQLIAALSLLGLLICFRDKPLLFLNTFFFSNVILWTNLVETQDYRHYYYLLPFLILSASRAFFQLTDFLLTRSKSLLRWTPAMDMAALTRLGLISMLFFSTNDYVLRLYNLPAASSDVELSRVETRDDGGLKKAIASVKMEIESGDTFIATRPHQLLFYSGHNALFAETVLKLPVVIPMHATFPVHRSGGSHWVYQADALTETLSKERRVWIVLESEAGLYDTEFLNLLKAQMLLKYRDSKTSIYFWGR